MGWFGVVGTGFDKRGEGVVYSGYETFCHLEGDILQEDDDFIIVESTVVDK